MIGGRVHMLFEMGTANVVGDGVSQFVYDTNRPAFLEGDLVGLCVNGNWQVQTYTNCDTPPLTTFAANLKLMLQSRHTPRLNNC